MDSNSLLEKTTQNNLFNDAKERDTTPRHDPIITLTLETLARKSSRTQPSKNTCSLKRERFSSTSSDAKIRNSSIIVSSDTLTERSETNVSGSFFVASEKYNLRLRDTKDVRARHRISPRNSQMKKISKMNTLTMMPRFPLMT